MSALIKNKGRSRIVLFVLVGAALFVGFIAWRWWGESTNWWIDRQVAAVEKRLSALDIATVELSGLSTQGGDAVVYREGKTLKKVNAHFLSEMGKRDISYYVSGTTPIFAREKVLHLSEPFGPVSDIEENRYYLSRGALRQWWVDDQKRQETDANKLAAKEKELSDGWDRLFTAISPRLAWVKRKPMPLATFIPGRMFSYNCEAGETGTFEPGGKLPVKLMQQFDSDPPPHVARWQLNGERLTLSQTTLSDNTYDEFSFQERDREVIATDPVTHGCGITIGASPEAIDQYEDAQEYYIEKSREEGTP